MLNITIQWVNELRSKLSAIDLQYVDKIWIKTSTLAIQSEARKEAPVDFGTLRNLIQYENLNNVWFVRSLAPYSIYVHEWTGIYARNWNWKKKPRSFKAKNGMWYKTKWTKANPFMERAKENKQDQIIQDYKDILQHHINKIWLNK
jgi:hypothetical protein